MIANDADRLRSERMRPVPSRIRLLTYGALRQIRLTTMLPSRVSQPRSTECSSRSASTLLSIPPTRRLRQLRGIAPEEG